VIFLSLPSAIIVVGGTLAATVVTYSFEEVWRAASRFARLLKRDVSFGKNDIDHLVDVAKIVQQGKLKDIEQEIDRTSSPFIKAGLMMLADGMKEDSLTAILQWRMKQSEATEHNEAAVFRTMAAYAPAFGMAGTLIGLVNMLRIMADGGTPAQIGLNMATALLTTFYGVILANAVFKPIAARIEKRSHERLRLMATIAEAMRSISERRSPSHVRELLYAMAVSHEEELGRRDTLRPMTEKDLYARD